MIPPNLQVKPLPRDEQGNILGTFKANGSQYYILQKLPILRTTHMQRMSSVVGYNASFTDLYHHNQKSIQLFNGLLSGKTTATDAALHLASINEGIQDASTQRWEKVYRYCALFICRVGEDLTVIDETLNDEKVADWNAEKIDPEDFFLLCRAFISGLNQAYQEGKSLTLAS